MDDRYPQLRAALSTREGFEKAVSFTSSWNIAIIFFGVFSAVSGVFLLLLVVMLTAQGVPLGDQISGMLAFKDIWVLAHWIFFGFFVVSISIVFVGLVVRRNTKKARFDEAFQRFPLSGFFATTYFCETTITSKKVIYWVSLYAHPSVPKEAIDGLMARLKAIPPVIKKSSEPRARPEEWGMRLLKDARVDAAIPAQQLEQTFPNGVWVALQFPTREQVNGIGRETGVAVLIPNGIERAMICPIKKGVSLS